MLPDQAFTGNLLNISILGNEIRILNHYNPISQKCVLSITIISTDIIIPHIIPCPTLNLDTFIYSRMQLSCTYM